MPYTIREKRRGGIQIKTTHHIALLAIGLVLSLQVFSQSYTFSITDYGATADGTTMNTKAIQSAIDAAAAIGGGRVIIPPGKYLTGGIELRDNIILERLCCMNKFNTIFR